MIVSVWLKCLIIRVSGVAMVGIPQARLSLCVHVLMHVCVALSPQQNRKSAGKERDCDLMCVCGQFTLTLPHKRLLWLIRGRREIDPSIHPPIHPPTHPPPLHGLRPLRVGQALHSPARGAPASRRRCLEINQSGWAWERAHGPGWWPDEGPLGNTAENRDELCGGSYTKN